MNSANTVNHDIYIYIYIYYVIINNLLHNIVNTNL